MKNINELHKNQMSALWNLVTKKKDPSDVKQGADQVDIDETLEMLDNHDCHHSGEDGCDCDCDWVREEVDNKIREEIRAEYQYDAMKEDPAARYFEERGSEL